jgi:hypothetical protein
MGCLKMGRRPWEWYWGVWGFVGHIDLAVGRERLRPLVRA